jgi:MFS family permease
VRGRFLGRRERWMLVGQNVATIVAAAFAQSWKQHVPQPLWIAYAITAGVGAVVMAASLLPLLQMPAAERRAAERPSPTGATPPRATPPRPAREGLPWRALVQPFRDGPFLRLLLFNCWFSACNGLTQTAQNLYPIRVLHISLALSLAVQTAMRGGQWAISPGLGRLADRRGNRPMMAVCLLIVALGPLCYCAATAERWQWYFGAWAAWVAYAGLNVGLPNLLLRLAPRQTDTPYIATYYAIGSACYAAATVAGGQALDWLRGRVWDVPGLGACDVYQVSFLLGWAARTAGAALLWLIVVEPPVARRPPPG